MTTEGYEYFDVAADVGVAAWGEDLPGCLRQCALGVFNLIVATEAVRPLESREVAARGPSVDALLGYATYDASTGQWKLTISTAGWAPGSYRLFARAKDGYGAYGDPFALTLELT